MPLIDTHVHLDLEDFDGDRHLVLERAQAAGVQRFIIPSIEPALTPRIQRLADELPGVFYAAGLHPNYAAHFQTDVVEALRALASHRRCVAVGEIGLDYHWDYCPVAVQRQAFEAQLGLAAELELPVIIHNREATDDVLAMLRSWVSGLSGQYRTRPGVLHAFSGSLEQAEMAVDLGFYIGIGGSVTYKKADNVRQVAVSIPLERLLIETDAPYLAPVPYRGKRNEPAYVQIVARYLADLRGISTEMLADTVWMNADQLFQLSVIENFSDPLINA